MRKILVEKAKELIINILRLFFYGTRDDITVMNLNNNIVSCDEDMYKKQCFKYDSLNREEIARNWTNSFLRNGISRVIAIDENWGMGKTYFATNWVKMLKHDNWQVCYIDAFEYDFTDDPFMVISHSIVEMLKSNNNFTELENIANYLGILFRAFKSNTINAIPSIAEGGVMALTGAPNNKIIKSGVKKITDIVINTLNESSREDSGSIHNPFISITENDMTYNNILKAFKKLLEKKANLVAKETGKPLVIIVDELDRCKPTFAIEFLEKLKHIFDVNNLVFITFINLNELSNAVKGMYGESFDGEKYLKKFFNLILSFPRLYGNSSLYTVFIKNQLNQSLCLDVFAQEDFFQANNILFPSDAVEPIIEIISLFQQVYNLSLRDIEQIIEILKYVSFKDKWQACFYVILRIIYVHNNKFYNEIKKLGKVSINELEDDWQTYKQLAKLYDEQKKNTNPFNAYAIFLQLTLIYASCNEDVDDESSIGSPLYPYSPQNYMKILMQLVESIC